MSDVSDSEGSDLQPAPNNPLESEYESRLDQLLSIGSAACQEIKRFQPDFVARLRRDLDALSDGIAAGQLSVREALLAERTIIETLQADAEARLAYARAFIELGRAAGRALPGVSP